MFRKGIAVLLIEVLIFGVFLAPAGAVTEAKGSKRIVLNVGMDDKERTGAGTNDRTQQLKLVPGSRCNLYFYLKNGPSTITATSFGSYQAIFKSSNGYTLTTRTLTLGTPYSAGCVYLTLNATDVTSLTKYAAVWCTSGTMRVLTDYFEVVPQGVSIP